MRQLALILMVALTGCAGMGTDYDTPAEAGQIPFEVEPITPGLVGNMKTVSADALPELSDRVARENYAYRIGPADVLSIYVDQPLFDAGSESDAPGQRTTESLYVVSEQGEIFLPLHGRLEVAGLTVTEAYEKIDEALQNFIEDPQINVRVAEFRSKRVTIANASGSGSYLPITDKPMTVLDAVLQTGAEGEVDLRNVVLKRNGNEYVIDVFALMDSPDFGREWLLRDEDVLVIPENLNAVYLLGEGPNTRKVIDPYQSTLASVLISDSGRQGGNRNGGFLNSGSTDLGSIFVIRGDTEFAQVYHLNAKTPDALILAEQFPMRHGDIVFVTTRPVTRFNRFIAETLPSLAPLYLVERAANF